MLIQSVGFINIIHYTLYITLEIMFLVYFLFTYNQFVKEKTLNYIANDTIFKDKAFL